MQIKLHFLNKIKFLMVGCCALTFHLVTSSCGKNQSTDIASTNSDPVQSPESFSKDHSLSQTKNGYLPQTSYPVPLNSSSILLPNANSPFGEAYTPISSIE